MAAPPVAAVVVPNISSTAPYASTAAQSAAAATAGPAFASTTASAGTGGSSNGAPVAAAPPCTTVTQTASSSCASGVCCTVKQRVTMCPKHTTALAEINGAGGACCVVLASRKTGVPAAFCATPGAKRGARQFPAGVSVSLSPECVAAKDGSIKAVLSCTATFSRLPRGYMLPAAHKEGGALSLRAGKAAPWGGPELAPCANRAYGRFTQRAAVDNVSGAVTLSTTCK